jgi:hypothetical protein
MTGNAGVPGVTGASLTSSSSVTFTLRMLRRRDVPPAGIARVSLGWLRLGGRFLLF